MDTGRKRRMFDLLVAMGYKEIEVAYPSASRTDFDFVRHLATSGAVPDDVTVSVFTPARPDLIERTFESVEGLPRTLVHLYIPTAPTWRDVVLGRSRAEILHVVRESATLMSRLADARPDADIRFEFSPEVFNLTEPDFVLELCNGLTELWQASPDRPVVHNLPATVEVATPNVYADQIEYMHRHLERRDSVILSVHPHNDRGTGVACAELAVLAGAQRVEGCLFGNGERTGNVDLVTLALNLHAQGIDPEIDFSDIDAVRDVVTECIQLPVHPRHPYGGDLVHTAFSGTHQDAISKGLAHHTRRAAELGVGEGQAPWAVPYLPIDPKDVGRTYEAVIRVNSQSGKGGIAHLLQAHHGVELPQALRADFSTVVQHRTDSAGAEVTPEDLWTLFRDTYLAPGHQGAVTMPSFSTEEVGSDKHRFTCDLVTADGPHRYEGLGNGPLSALTAALGDAGIAVDILGYTEHATTTGPDSPAMAYVRCRVDEKIVWGAGQDTSVLTASVRAVVAAVNRAGGRGRREPRALTGHRFRWRDHGSASRHLGGIRAAPRERGRGSSVRATPRRGRLSGDARRGALGRPGAAAPEPTLPQSIPPCPSGARDVREPFTSVRPCHRPRRRGGADRVGRNGHPGRRGPAGERRRPVPDRVRRPAHLGPRHPARLPRHPRRPSARHGRLRRADLGTGRSERPARGAARVHQGIRPGHRHRHRDLAWRLHRLAQGLPQRLHHGLRDGTGLPLLTARADRATRTARRLHRRITAGQRLWHGTVQLLMPAARPPPRPSPVPTPPRRTRASHCRPVPRCRRSRPPGPPPCTRPSS